MRSGAAGGITAAAWTIVVTPSPYERNESRRVTSPPTPSAAQSRPGSPGSSGGTRMWLVGLSDVGLCAMVGEGTWESCAQRLAADPLPPLAAYVAPRCVQAVLTAALLALMALLSVEWLGYRPAALGCALLALEPFFLGYQRFITTDALATDLGAVAALWFLLYLRDGHRRRLGLLGPVL